MRTHLILARFPGFLLCFHCCCCWRCCWLALTRCVRTSCGCRGRTDEQWMEWDSMAGSNKFRSSRSSSTSSGSSERGAYSCFVLGRELMPGWLVGWLVGMALLLLFILARTTTATRTGAMYTRRRGGGWWCTAVGKIRCTF